MRILRMRGGVVHPSKVPPLRPTEGSPVVTSAKLAVLTRLHRGDLIGVKSSWVVRTLVADGLVRAHPVEPLAELTPLGVFAAERGIVGPVVR